MNHHTARTSGSLGRARTAGFLAGALATTAVTLAAGLVSAPPANATCASFFGIGNSANCSSNLTSIAIAIGTDAQAHADGLFGAAFAVGTDAKAFTLNAFSFAASAGDHNDADAEGVFALAVQLGSYGEAFTAGVANIAINLTPGQPATGFTLSDADGYGNIAVNLFGTAAGSLTHEVRALGIAGIAANVGGNDNDVRAGAPGAVGNVAVALFGSFNQVESGPGPFALAGSVGQTGKVIQKVGPGFNINGFAVGGAAAVPATPSSVRAATKAPAHATTAKPAAASAAVDTGASPAGSTSAHRTRAAGHAAVGGHGNSGRK